MIERRKYPRRDMECPLQIRVVDGDINSVKRNSFCKNISRVGLATMSFDFFPVNAIVHLQLFSETLGKILEVIGKVVWIKQLRFQHKYKLGIEFVDNSPDVEIKILDILQKGYA